MLRCAILVSGRGSNMEAILKAKASGDLPIEVEQWWRRDRPGAPAITIARRYGVEYFRTEPRTGGGQADLLFRS